MIFRYYYHLRKLLRHPCLKQCAALLLGSILAIVWVLGGCTPPRTDAKLSFVTTIPPLGMILSEIVGDRGEVSVLLDPGTSPHTYAPRPSEIRLVDGATAFFFCSDLLDGWAAGLGGEDTIEVFKLVPRGLKLELTGKACHGHGSGAGNHEHHGSTGESQLDPHFWLSPGVVRETLPLLTAELVQVDPGGRETYEANAATFATRLSALEAELAAQLATLKGEHLLLVHPSFQYLMHDYGLELAAVIETVPGKEPTPRLLAELIELTSELKLKAVFSEPQLALSPVQTIADETGLPIYLLDPIGGVAGRESYVELLLYNANILTEALGSGVSATAPAHDGQAPAPTADVSSE